VVRTHQGLNRIARYLKATLYSPHNQFPLITLPRRAEEEGKCGCGVSLKHCVLAPGDPFHPVVAVACQARKTTTKRVIIARLLTFKGT